MARQIHGLIGRGTGPLIVVENGATKLSATVNGLPEGETGFVQVREGHNADAAENTYTMYELDVNGEVDLVVGSCIQFSYEGAGTPVFTVKVS